MKCWLAGAAIVVLCSARLSADTPPDPAAPERAAALTAIEGFLARYLALVAPGPVVERRSLIHEWSAGLQGELGPAPPGPWGQPQGQWLTLQNEFVEALVECGTRLREFRLTDNGKTRLRLALAKWGQPMPEERVAQVARSIVESQAPKWGAFTLKTTVEPYATVCWVTASQYAQPDGLPILGRMIHASLELSTGLLQFYGDSATNEEPPPFPPPVIVRCEDARAIALARLQADYAGRAEIHVGPWLAQDLCLTEGILYQGQFSPAKADGRRKWVERGWRQIWLCTVWFLVLDPPAPADQPTKRRMGTGYRRASWIDAGTGEILSVTQE